MSYSCTVTRGLIYGVEHLGCLYVYVSTNILRKPDSEKKSFCFDQRNVTQERLLN